MILPLQHMLHQINLVEILREQRRTPHPPLLAGHTFRQLIQHPQKRKNSTLVIMGGGLAAHETESCGRMAAAIMVQAP